MDLVHYFCLILVFTLGQTVSGAQDTPESPSPFEQFTFEDSLERNITAYLSKAPAKSGGKPLPVILFVSGSGCQSVWSRHEKGVNIGLQGLLMHLAADRARVLVVEKPGVRAFDSPTRVGTAMEGSREFLEEHTLPRWATANVDALKVVLARPDIDPKRALVVGHSEGGIAAAWVSHKVSAVTHVAPLSCSGVTQLFSVAEMARRRAPEGHGDAAVKAVYEKWDEILTKPESIDDFWMGHPYRRWSSFLKFSVIDELKKGAAKVYLAHGTADESDSVIGFDVMHAELLAVGRDVTAERVEGGDHGYSVNGQNGIQRVFGNVVEWFLK